MRYLLPLFLLLLGPALAWCPPPRMTPPDYPELPEGRDEWTPVGQVSLTISPQGLGEPKGKAQAWARADGVVEWIRIRWDSAKKNLGETKDGKNSVFSTVTICGSSVQGKTRPLSRKDNGLHKLVAEAKVWWKVWRKEWRCKRKDSEGNTYYETRYTYGKNSELPSCSLQKQGWVIRSGLAKKEGYLGVFISWDQELGYDDLYKELAPLLWDIYRKYGEGSGARGFSVDAFAKELASDELRKTLQDMASGAFIDCGWFGICRRMEPVKMRWLSDVPSSLADMIRKGALCGGIIRFCWPQDSRLADIGPRIEIKSFLMIRTPTHDFLLLDRVIPRRYYDPKWIYQYPGGDGKTAPKTPADSYDAVTEEERQQVLASCRAYKDTEEGRRCATVIELMSGTVQVLRQMLMVDFLFENSKEVQ